MCHRYGRSFHARKLGPVAQDRHAAFRKVGHREARREGQHRIVLALEPREHGIKTLRRLDERALRRQPGQEIQPVKRTGGRFAQAQGPVEQPRRALTGRRHVDVRVGAICDQAVALLDHRARDIGVQVEAGDDRRALSDDAAHAREQLAFAVVQVLGDHRAVQIEVDPVHGSRRGEPC